MAYESNVDKAIKKVNDTVIKALEAVGNEIANEAIAIAPVDNGELRQDIKYQVDLSNNQVLIGNTLEYAIYVNKGTGIYAEDKNGRQDKWKYYSPSKKRFFTTKGQKPQPYLKDAVKRSNKRVIKISKDILKEIGD